ncbi:response regulator [Candidatus Neomarinimicrobiota bacterium]
MNIKEKEYPGRPTILVVEDNEANLNYLVFLLKKLRLNVISTANGEDAIEMMENKEADGMLLDINLGSGISGIMLMETFRKDSRFQELPISAVTAYYGGGLSEELLSKGFTDYLSKPFTFDELKNLLSKFLENDD